MLTLLFVLLGIADLEFAKFSFWHGNPLPIVRGIVIGGALTSAFLILWIWTRHMWARYALIVLNWGMIAAFSMPGLIILDKRAPGQVPSLLHLTAGLLLYILGNIILIRSRNIRRLATPPRIGH